MQPGREGFKGSNNIKIELKLRFAVFFPGLWFGLRLGDSDSKNNINHQQQSYNGRDTHSGSWCTRTKKKRVAMRSRKKKPKGDGGSKTFEAHLRQMSLLSSLRDLLCGYGWCGVFHIFRRCCQFVSEWLLSVVWRMELELVFIAKRQPKREIRNRFGK